MHQLQQPLEITQHVALQLTEAFGILTVLLHLLERPFPVALVDGPAQRRCAAEVSVGQQFDLADAESLASKRLGALIVLERDMGLRTFYETGIALDAEVSYDLLMNIFTFHSPLHDGAAVADVQTTVDDYLAKSSVSGASVATTPTTLGAAQPGEPVTVTVSVPFADVSWIRSPWFFEQTVLTASTLMRREGIR